MSRARLSYLSVKVKWSRQTGACPVLNVRRRCSEPFAGSQWTIGQAASRGSKKVVVWHARWCSGLGRCYLCPTKAPVQSWLRLSKRHSQYRGERDCVCVCMCVYGDTLGFRNPHSSYTPCTKDAYVPVMLRATEFRRRRRRAAGTTTGFQSHLEQRTSADGIEAQVERGH